jgi:NADH:ubiquinone oxidoreductase subunit 2 (subunit N)
LAYLSDYLKKYIIMSLSLQQHIFNLLPHTPSMPGLLNLRTVPPVAGGAFIDSFVYTMAQIFIMSDMLLYVGCVFIILVLGSGYKQRKADKLVISLVRTSNIFIYLALLINLLGLIMGSELIASHDITIFEGSYTFNLFSQLCKLLLLVMMASFYVLFPTVIRSRMRILELPLLLQISVSLCVTIISSTNFALLLLALEGFSLTLYILTALGRTYGGVTAAVKYFAFGTLGSIFLF